MEMKKHLSFLLSLLLLVGCAPKGEVASEVHSTEAPQLVEEVSLTMAPTAAPTATPEPTLEPTAEPIPTPEPLHLTQEDVAKYKDCVVMPEGYSAPDYLVVTHTDGTVSAGVFFDLFAAESWTDIVAVSGAENHVAGLRADGTVVAAGSNKQGQLNVQDWTDIIGLATGNDFTLGLRSDGTVAVVGEFTYAEGEMPLAEALSSWTDIVAIAAAGNRVVLGLKADGTVVYFSSMTYHVEDWTDIVSIAASEDYVAGLRKDGTVVTAVLEEFKSWVNKDALKVDNWRDVQQLFLGRNTTFGVQSDGTVLVAGENATPEAKALKGLQSFADGWVLQADGTLCYVLDARLYGDGTSGMENVLEAEGIRQVAACNGRFLALLEDGRVVMGGYPNEIVKRITDWEELKAAVEQKAAEEESDLESYMPSNADMVQVVASTNSVYGLKADGTVVPFYCLRDEDFSQWQGITRLALIGDMLLGLKEDGTMVAAGEYSGIDGWGHNGYSGEYDISKWKDVQEIFAGSDRYMGIRADGTVVMAGNGAGKAQGDLRAWTDIVQVDVDNPDCLGLKSDGTVVLAGMSGISEYPEGALEEIAQWQDIVKVNLRAWQYALGLKGDGTVEFVWLNPYHGSSGEEKIGEWTDIVDIVSSSGHTVGLRSDGTVVAIGENYAGQCDVEDWENVVAIYAAYEVTVGLKADGTLCVAGNIDPNSNTIQALTHVGVPVLK